MVIGRIYVLQVKPRGGKNIKWGAIPCWGDGGNDEVGQPIIVLLVCRLHLDSLYIHDYSAIIQWDGEHVWLKRKHRFFNNGSQGSKRWTCFQHLLIGLLKGTHTCERFAWKIISMNSNKKILYCLDWYAAYKIRHVSMERGMSCI